MKSVRTTRRSRKSRTSRHDHSSTSDQRKSRLVSTRLVDYRNVVQDIQEWIVEMIGLLPEIWHDLCERRRWIETTWIAQSITGLQLRENIKRYWSSWAPLSKWDETVSHSKTLCARHSTYWLREWLRRDKTPTEIIDLVEEVCNVRGECEARLKEFLRVDHNAVNLEMYVQSYCWAIRPLYQIQANADALQWRMDGFRDERIPHLAREAVTELNEIHLLLNTLLIPTSKTASLPRRIAQFIFDSVTEFQLRVKDVTQSREFERDMIRRILLEKVVYSYCKWWAIQNAYLLIGTDYTRYWLDLIARYFRDLVYLMPTLHQSPPDSSPELSGCIAPRVNSLLTVASPQ